MQGFEKIKSHILRSTSMLQVYSRVRVRLVNPTSVMVVVTDAKVSVFGTPKNTPHPRPMMTMFRRSTMVASSRWTEEE